MSNFNVEERLRPIVETVRENTSVEDDIVVFSDDLFEKTLPKGLTLDAVNQMERHRADLILAATLVGGEHAADMFSENEDLDMVSGGIVMGEHTRGVFTSVRRSDMNGETVYGSPRFVVTHSLPDNDSNATKIRDHIHRLAKQMLSE